jgi:hypothetical protein
MSEFKFNCPHCQQSLKCEETLSGKQIVCPACKHLFRIPPAPGQATAGHYTPESGRTWDTFMPPKKEGGLKVVTPPSDDSGRQPQKNP